MMICVVYERSSAAFKYWAQQDAVLLEQERTQTRNKR